MFGRIARLRRHPRYRLLEIDHFPGCRGGRPPHLGASRDRAALTMLLRTHRAAVIHFLYRMVQDQTVAEELAVEAFLRIYRSDGEGSGPTAQPATRLLRVATDLVLKELANRQSHPAPAALADVFEGPSRAVACMPGRQRAAVLMHKYHQMDSWQIASVLDCPEPIARSLLLSAYDRLRGSIARDEAARNRDYAAP
ncbi:MAG TPA: RNA polymerase sigma factor [Bryobacteraceae bacterium]|nr:RNA polymerase sigma factor [Bryobacteraceae bacterium]